MNNYFFHLEQFADDSVLHIGICDKDEKVKIFDITKYNNNLSELCLDLILYITEDKTEDCNLYFHDYEKDKKLINEAIRSIPDIIIKPEDASFNNKNNSSGKATIFLKNSRNLIDKDLSQFDEHFNLDIKNDIIINNAFFTPDTYNKTVLLSEYTAGLDESQIISLSSYVEVKQEEIKNSIDLTISPPIIDTSLLTFTPLPTNLPDIDPRVDFFILKENLILASQPNDGNLKFNPTNILTESTSINTKLLKRGLFTVL